MLTRPTFLVAETQPVYCQITDGLIGSTTRIVDAARSVSHAFAIASRRGHQEYTGCGDGYFSVKQRDDLGRLRDVAWPHVVVAPVDDMPF